ncbi:MAG: hypothetical protein LBV48_01935 [Mycoplasmataceae bacterium]|jgi:hypothetical protein|nr:hypothetical protein [Mycoplasmataceae bacterium]
MNKKYKSPIFFFKSICLCSIVPLCIVPIIASTACNNTKIYFAYVNSDGSASSTILRGNTLTITVSSNNVGDVYVWNGYTTSGGVTISITGQRNEQMIITNNNSTTTDIVFSGIWVAIQGKSKKVKKIVNKPSNITVFNYEFSYPGDSIEHVTYGSYVTITPLSYWYPNSNYIWHWHNLVDDIVDIVNDNTLTIINNLEGQSELAHISADVTDGGLMTTRIHDLIFYSR